MLSHSGQNSYSGNEMAIPQVDRSQKALRKVINSEVDKNLKHLTSKL